ncbi:septal ring factor EnvC (AmiA/AmiB activator) [Pseudoxanthomonas broegbernensis]|nr:peptidoglycan DD-metalloendopeptidase family protein [Pseudoxanthomonas broegbernensis]MBB6066456.1 septal ring factor EnvC (AmiA/AmiB activator) [Pseudoxanthomonas broegbernensis]
MTHPRERCSPRLARHRRVASVLLAWIFLVLAAAAAGAQEKRDAGAAERELRKVRAELQEIARERRRLEAERGDAAVRLRRADEQLGRSTRELAETEAALQREQQALAALRQQRERMQHDLEDRRERLATLLRASYALGPQVPLKLLLAQERVSEAQRTLAYYRYAQRAHADQVTGLADALHALEATEAQIGERTQALEILRAEQRQALEATRRDRGHRVALVGELDQRYQDRHQREKALGQDAKSLESLLNTLRAAAARAEADRRAAARRAAQAQAERPAGQGKVPPRVASAAPPPKVGGLGWPASGDLLARFGGRLPDGRSSNGVLIGAPAGTAVTAVADGTVVFSEWMTGYGLILIVDHGNGYMSLYAHNDTLLRDAGDRVRRGDAVARVGSSGGHGRPALYFELRRNGQPVDPSSWLQRR